MAKIWNGPPAGDDARKDLFDSATDLCNFVGLLGMRWAAIRNLIPDEGNGHRIYELLSRDLVEMLDDAGDILVCEHEDCLKPVHGDWDFCESHGEESEDDSEV